MVGGQRSRNLPGSLMEAKITSYALQYAVYLLEGGLLCYLVFKSRSRRLTALTLYVALLLVVDGITRPFVLYTEGLTSRAYWYTFWLTDVLLTLAAFILVCFFFRRACAQKENIWRQLRMMLLFVFVLVVGISSFSLFENYKQFLTSFVVEFEQNLYFTCLVLNTLLFVFMQQARSADDELGLLVCGLGVQFAGPAASLALAHLTLDQVYSEGLVKLIMPLCTMGMLLTWLYAVARVPKRVEAFDLTVDVLSPVRVGAREV